MGPAAFVAVNDTRGISKPLLVEDTSNIADASGVAPVELIPTFCANNPNEAVAVRRVITANLLNEFIFSFFSGSGDKLSENDIQRCPASAIRTFSSITLHNICCRKPKMKREGISVF